MQDRGWNVPRSGIGCKVPYGPFNTNISLLGQLVGSLVHSIVCNVGVFIQIPKIILLIIIIIIVASEAKQPI